MENDYNSSAVIFEENTFTSRQLLSERTQPLLIKLAMKTGWFKTEKQAILSLLGVVILFMLLSLIIIKFVIFPPLPETTPLDDISFIEESQIDPDFLEALRKMK